MERVSPVQPGGDARLSTSDAETLKPCLFKMRRTPVDDVQGSCYYHTVPRAKSGLPVYGCPVGCATCAGGGPPADLRWALKKYVPGLELGSGTPSLKRPAKTFAPGPRGSGWESREAMQGESRRNGTPPNLTGGGVASPPWAI